MDNLLQGTLSSKVIPAALHASVAGSASACSLLSQAAAGLQRTQTGVPVRQCSQLTCFLICHQARRCIVTPPSAGNERWLQAHPCSTSCLTTTGSV